MEKTDIAYLTCVCENTQKVIYSLALLIIARTWKQIKCSSVSEWMTKFVYADHGILFSTEKK